MGVSAGVDIWAKFLPVFLVTVDLLESMQAVAFGWILGQAADLQVNF